MEYSITSLAKKARVTTRTLRHYDQIGLLKPSVRMANGKRIYSEEQFMRLYEIVFFKKIGIGLPKIKEIFTARDANKAAAAALLVRKEALTKEIKKLQRYATSIETVLPQYKNCSLNQKEKLEQFRSYLNMVREMEEIQMKEMGKEAFKKAQEKIETLSEEEVDALAERSNKWFKQIVKAVEEGLDPSSKEVQKMVQQYYDLMIEFHSVTREIWLKLRDSILERRECYVVYHPKLPEFLYHAFDQFATQIFKNQNK